MLKCLILVHKFLAQKHESFTEEVLIADMGAGVGWGSLIFIIALIFLAFGSNHCFDITDLLRFASFYLLFFFFEFESSQDIGGREILRGGPDRASAAGEEGFILRQVELGGD